MPSYSRFKLTTKLTASRSQAGQLPKSPVTLAAPVSLQQVLIGASFAELMWPGLTSRFKVSMDSLLSRQLLEREYVLRVWKEVSFHASYIHASLVLGTNYLEWTCASQNRRIYPWENP